LIFKQIDALKKAQQFIGHKTELSFMKKCLLSILFFFIAASHLSAKTPWESYLTLPIPERASTVDGIEYSPESSRETGEDLAHDLNILRDQVLACDREAFRLAYRLAGNAADGLRGDLNAILGQTIRTHPDFFLKEMSRLQPNQEALKSILMASGYGYTGRNYARRYELYMRRMALTDVSSRTLQEFRDTCLELIDIH
jgi:hypothetical protein